MVSIRIVSVDYYMSPPIQSLDVMYSEFRSTSISLVPVIRIFGSLSTGIKANRFINKKFLSLHRFVGKKICLHVHGVFPYIYIPYDGSEPIDTVAYQTAATLDKSLNVLMGQSASNAQHIYKVTLVSGK